MAVRFNEKGFTMDLVPALVAIAKASNVIGKVFEDGAVGLNDLGVIFGSMGDLQGLVGINYAAALSEAGKLSPAVKAEAVAAFKKAFDLPNDVTEAAVEGGVDAAFTVLEGVVKGQAALALLLPKAA
jgi:hypothetical protein